MRFGHAPAWVAVSCGLLAGGAATVAAESPTDVASLAAVADADPLLLAREVALHGDGVVLRGLGAEQPGRVRLAAVRAAKWMDAPWVALDLLSQLVGGRDSELAPAAARAVVAIAERTDAAALQAAEVLPEELLGAVERLNKVVADDSARADIRLQAGQAASMLAAAGVVAPPG